MEYKKLINAHAGINCDLAAKVGFEFLFSHASGSVIGKQLRQTLKKQEVEEEGEKHTHTTTTTTTKRKQRIGFYLNPHGNGKRVETREEIRRESVCRPVAAAGDRGGLRAAAAGKVREMERDGWCQRGDVGHPILWVCFPQISRLFYASFFSF